MSVAGVIKSVLSMIPTEIKSSNYIKYIRIAATATASYDVAVQQQYYCRVK